MGGNGGKVKRRDVGKRRGGLKGVRGTKVSADGLEGWETGTPRPTTVLLRAFVLSGRDTEGRGTSEE